MDYAKMMEDGVMTKFGAVEHWAKIEVCPPDASASPRLACKMSIVMARKLSTAGLKEQCQPYVQSSSSLSNNQQQGAANVMNRLTR